jgi:hypothetical protein
LFDADADPGVDPGYQNDANPCGSGSATLVPDASVIISLGPCSDGRRRRSRRRMDEVNGNGKRLPKLREILRRQKQDSEVWNMNK